MKGMQTQKIHLIQLVNANILTKDAIQEELGQYIRYVKLETTS